MFRESNSYVLQVPRRLSVDPNNSPAIPKLKAVTPIATFSGLYSLIWRPILFTLVLHLLLEVADTTK
jgi:hypothetical protein